MRRQLGRRSMRRGSGRAALSWSDISSTWLMTAVTATTAVELIRLQSPAALSALTSDPPEDLTVLRVVGDYLISMASGVASWTLALIVADVTWTPATAFGTDADKRILWHRTYIQEASEATAFLPPDRMMLVNAAGTFMSRTNATHLDIAPRVRIEPGKALYLVGYENSASTAMTTVSVDMRCLYKRSGRR